jgi:hypothetical protein
MVINNTTTQVEFFPFVSFDDAIGEQVDVQVWHKQTKTMAEVASNVNISGSKITLTLPSLTTIAAVAENLDTILIRVIYDDVLKWEYLATWSTESVNLNKEFKQWDEVTPTQPNWIKI